MNPVDYRALANQRYSYLEGMRDMRHRAMGVACIVAVVAFGLGAWLF